MKPEVDLEFETAKSEHPGCFLKRLFDILWIFDATFGPNGRIRESKNRTFWHHVGKKGGKMISKSETKKTSKNESKNDPKMEGSGMQNRGSRSILVSK